VVWAGRESADAASSAIVTTAVGIVRERMGTSCGRVYLDRRRRRVRRS
jgi:hypothetical protein